jgi:hypothetical protein
MTDKNCVSKVFTFKTKAMAPPSTRLVNFNDKLACQILNKISDGFESNMFLNIAHY